MYVDGRDIQWRLSSRFSGGRRGTFNDRTELVGR